jgi:hypothetical protein
MRSSWWRRVRYTYFAGVQPRQGLVHHVCVRVCLSVCLCLCVCVCTWRVFDPVEVLYDHLH